MELALIVLGLVYHLLSKFDECLVGALVDILADVDN